METNKQITIDIPDGYIIDEEKSVLKEGNIVFKKKEVVLPKTWEEALRMRVISGLSLISDCYLNPQLKSYASLRKLEILRDIYRQGWKPDWKNVNQEKYCICANKDFLKTIWAFTLNRFLCFQSEEIRDEFLKNFKNLIEECKEFI